MNTEKMEKVGTSHIYNIIMTALKALYELVDCEQEPYQNIVLDDIDTACSAVSVIFGESGGNVPTFDVDAFQRLRADIFARAVILPHGCGIVSDATKLGDEARTAHVAARIAMREWQDTREMDADLDA